MNFYERVVSAALSCEDCEVEALVLGWHASGIILKDGRWGLGAVPNPRKEAHVVREQHTQDILNAGAHALAKLIVSPFPQEFAAASAAVSALLPPPGEGLSLDTLRFITGGERVAVLEHHRGVVPFLRDLGWDLVETDDLKDINWAWLTAEALRDRALVAAGDELKRMNAVFLQGAGVPWLERGYDEWGVKYLVLPHLATSEISPRDVLARIAVGSDPWNDGDLIWRVHPV